LYRKFHLAFGADAEVTPSQNWDLQRLLKPYSNIIEKAVSEAYAAMEEWLEGEHLHGLDEHDEDCELCVELERDSARERYLDDYEYRRSV
jgi:hypothetical protein